MSLKNFKQQRWNLVKEKKSYLKIAIFLIITGIVLVVLVGCTPKQSIQCIDNRLYSVTLQRVELLGVEDCEKGRIELREDLR